MHNRVGILKQQLQNALEMELFVGVPDGTAADLFLFPYRLHEEHFHRAATDTGHLPPEFIEFLLIPTPRFEYAALDQACQRLQGNPFTEAESCMIEYRRIDSSIAELAQIFLAAQIPLTLSAAFQARFFHKA